MRDLLHRVLQPMLRPLRQQLANLVARAVVNVVTDSLKMQALQLTILEGETREDAERFQQYGLTSHPLTGAEAVALSVGGRRDHLLVISVDDRRHRLKDLAPGEVALYTDEGARVHLKRGRIVVTDEEIRLGSDSASNFVALANLVTAELTSLKTKIAASSASFLDGGVAINAQLVGWPGSVAATKVKAE